MQEGNMELFAKAFLVFSVVSAIIAVTAYLLFPRLVQMHLKEQELCSVNLLGDMREWDCFRLGWKYNGGRIFVILPLGHQPGGEVVRVMDLGMRSGDTFYLSRTLPTRKVFSLAPRCQESVLRNI